MYIKAATNDIKVIPSQLLQNANDMPDAMTHKNLLLVFSAFTKYEKQKTIRQIKNTDKVWVYAYRIHPQ